MTVLLVCLFAAAVAVITIAVYFAIMFILFCSSLYSMPSSSKPFVWWDQKILLYTSITTLFVVIISSASKIKALSRGGSYIAQMMGGRLINFNNPSPEEKRFINVVEEMSIASGVSVPLIYVLDKEQGINAFAAGYTPNSAIIAATSGCLKLLSRDELQGVVAHEYSHILNGDMRLNIRLMGFLGGIHTLSTIGYFVLRGSSRGRRGSFSGMFFGLMLLTIGSIGMLCARIIQCAVSRQREFLADASSVQFTRNPDGLSGALQKIGGYVKSSKIMSPEAKETCHMFFSNALTSFFATHPPLKERIRLIDPNFRGRFKKISMKDIPSFTAATDLSNATAAQSSFAGEQEAVTPESVLSSVGTVSPENVSQSSDLLKELPASIKRELSVPLDAAAITCCLVLDKSPEKRGKQISNINKSAPKALLAEILRHAKTVIQVEQKLRLPIVDLAIPALRQLSSPQYDNFIACIKTLIEADNKISLFEFSVYTIIKHRLDMEFKNIGKKTVHLNGPQLQADLLLILSLLAYSGNTDSEKTQKAFEACQDSLINIMGKAPILPLEKICFSSLGKALERIASEEPKLKKMAFEACTRCVLFDKIVSKGEAELLRAVAYCFDLPLPPFLPQHSKD